MITDSDLSLRIAEHLFQPDKTRCGRCGWPLKERIEDGCTAQVCTMIDPPIRRTPDMVNDPAMTVMLMKRKDFVSVDQISDGSEPEIYDATFCSAEVHSLDCHRLFDVQNPKLGRAVAEAFAIAKGLL